MTSLPNINADASLSFTRGGGGTPTRDQYTL